MMTLSADVDKISTRWRDVVVDTRCYYCITFNRFFEPLSSLMRARDPDGARKERQRQPCCQTSYANPAAALSVARDAAMRRSALDVDARYARKPARYAFFFFFSLMPPLIISIFQN